MNFDIKPIKIESPYMHEGKSVPRVTDILSSMLHEDYLMIWSNRIGFGRTDYKTYLNKAAEVGSITHKAIEDFLTENKLLIIENVSREYRSKVYNTFNGFLKWWDIIKKNDYEILMVEHKLVSQYFGGTLDLLIKINGKIYLVDFKTSKQVSYKYTLQLSGYRKMLRESYGIEIDGCIILLLNKYSPDFEEHVYIFEDANMKEYFDKCEECFLSLVFAYYNRKYIEDMYKSL